MDEEFAKSLVKGRIAETIFEEMFRETGNYTIIPFGYERLVPEMANCRQFSSAQKVIDNIRTAPDYAVISRDKKKVFLVEVKFRKNFDYFDKILEMAAKQLKRWSPSWIFIATLEGFYLDQCDHIVKYGKIDKLSTQTVNQELQNKYMKLIQEFEK